MPDTTDFNSGQYWTQRYEEGGTSGAGSYGRLAVYKANVVNVIAHEHGVRSVLELGCGDGNQFGLLAVRNYVGADISDDAVRRCRELHSDRPNSRFVSMEELADEKGHFDLVLSLDVIFHLVEDEVFDRYMTTVFERSKQFVLIYSSNAEHESANPHVRHRCFTDWVDANAPQFALRQRFDQPFKMTEKSNPRHTTHAEFRLYERTDVTR